MTSLSTGVNTLRTLRSVRPRSVGAALKQRVDWRPLLKASLAGLTWGCGDEVGTLRTGELYLFGLLEDLQVGSVHWNTHTHTQFEHFTGHVNVTAANCSLSSVISSFCGLNTTTVTDRLPADQLIDYPTSFQLSGLCLEAAGVSVLDSRDETEQRNNLSTSSHSLPVLRPLPPITTNSNKHGGCCMKYSAEIFRVDWAPSLEASDDESHVNVRRLFPLITRLYRPLTSHLSCGREDEQEVRAERRRPPVTTQDTNHDVMKLVFHFNFSTTFPKNKRSFRCEQETFSVRSGEQRGTNDSF